MSRKKTMSLRTRLLLLVSFIVLLGFAITLTLLSRQTGKLQHRTALQYTTQLAANEGAKRAVLAVKSVGFPRGPNSQKAGIFVQHTFEQRIGTAALGQAIGL